MPERFSSDPDMEKTTDPPVLGPLGDALAFHLRLAQAASFRGFQRRVGLERMRPGWFSILSLIHDNPDITPAVLSRACGRDKSTLTPVLRDLERDGLIARLVVPGDRRRHALRLTLAGEAALAHLAAHADAHDADLDRLAGEHKAVVLDVLRRMIRAFE